MTGKSSGQFFDGVMRRRLILLAGLLALVAILGGFSTRISEKHVSSSPEVRFTDSSHRGLAIVPASCPSDPHYAGDCTNSPPTPPSYNTCSLSASPYNVAPGQSTTLTWTVNSGPYVGSNVSGSINPGGLPAPGTYGSVIVSPSQSTTYTYSGVTYLFGVFPLASYACSATVAVADQSCPIGYVLQGNQCVLSACPSGYTLQGGGCVISSCPAGYTLQNGQCVNQCGAQFFCQGNDLYKRDASCNASLFTRCVNGCSAGSCLGAPAPSIVLWKVNPILVKSGTPVNVEWQAQNVASCAISGTNGDSWSCTGKACNTDTIKPSKPIIAQTIYTITCQALAGGSPSSVTQSTTVNIIPVFQEK